MNCVIPLMTALGSEIDGAAPELLPIGVTVIDVVEVPGIACCNDMLTMIGVPTAALDCCGANDAVMPPARLWAGAARPIEASTKAALLAKVRTARENRLD